MSTQAKHTPGPWEVTPAGGISGNGEAIVINSVESCAKWGKEPMNDGFGNAGANARLIAAAPDLLRALQDVLSALQPICDHADARAVSDRDMRAFDRACGSARAIIEKATRS